jgi:DNA invertase Pin-like site-specific DNA recombinase
MATGTKRALKKVRSDEFIGYIRVSTDQQAESGAGMAAQRAAILAQCKHNGWELARIYEDNGASAKALTGRPGLSEALQVLSQGDAAALVVSKLDRLARSVHDFAGLVRVAEREGWGIVALDLGVDMTTPTGGLLANVTASVAEWERRIISVRTSEALAQRKAAGVQLGRPRTLDPAIAKKIRSLRAEGVTLQAIADELNSEGVATPSGRTWSPALVRKVSLQQPRSANVRQQ